MNKRTTDAALSQEIANLREALRSAPMPYRESVLGDDWDEYYDRWWHNNASEKAIEAMKRNI